MRGAQDRAFDGCSVDGEDGHAGKVGGRGVLAKGGEVTVRRCTRERAGIETLLPVSSGLAITVDGSDPITSRPDRRSRDQLRPFARTTPTTNVPLGGGVWQMGANARQLPAISVGPTGKAQRAWRIPNDPTLVGATLRVQGAWVEAGASGLTITPSNTLIVTVGG